ncbi:hypothetical protein O181_073018 [Austropuccinia psidii MF-1]|uniref:Mannosyltransferase n=1 Tax=Austropuccinia psidii MF-1 TaxID=1389203 RepID=A0A9Q3I9N8_9BASI|nr:hypothetical protein [Austropuccinia psidii MF-1]
MAFVPVLCESPALWGPSAEISISKASLLLKKLKKLKIHSNWTVIGVFSPHNDGRPWHPRLRLGLNHSSRPFPLESSASAVVMPSSIRIAHGIGSLLRSRSRIDVASESTPPCSRSFILIEASIGDFHPVLLVQSHSAWSGYEFYQSLEISHLLVFDYGFKTWEWDLAKIRSPIHPYFFSLGYWLLKVSNLDQTNLLVIVPKIFQAIIASLIDLGTFHLASNLLNQNYSIAALACSLTCFFNAYTSIRTSSNSLETALLTWSLALWPWDPNHLNLSCSKFIISISLIFGAFLIRPSSILFSSSLIFYLLLKSNLNIKLDILAWLIVIGFTSCFLGFLIDSSFYGEPTFTPLNFFKQNLLNKISNYYGSNPWHYYFSQAFPFINLSFFPTVLIGLFPLSIPQSPLESVHQITKLQSARFVIFSTIIGFSFLPHKEFRFIQPLVPLFNIFAARAMVNNHTRQNLSQTQLTHQHNLEGSLKFRLPSFIFRSIISLGLAFYLMTFHYPAQISVMSYLRSLPNHQLKSIGFLMPCHSTPWQSHLHKPHLAPNGSLEPMWMLTCDPPLNFSNNSLQSNQSAFSNQFKTAPFENYIDEADQFYLDPQEFLLKYFPKHVNPTFPPTNKSNKSYQWPSHLVIFEALWKLNGVRNILEKLGYQVVWRASNSRWHDDPIRRGGSVMVLKWKN